MKWVKLWTGIFTHLFILIIILFFTNCQKDTQNDPTLIINFKEEDAKTFKVSDWVDSIEFILLERQNQIIGLQPDRLKIIEGNIIYLYNPDGSNSVLNIHDLNGKSKIQILTDKYSQYPIKLINDFDLFKDSLYLLNGENISVISLKSNARILPDIPVPSYYSAMFYSSPNYCLFSPLLSHALTILNHEGKTTAEKVPLNEIPTFKGDRFPHFSKSYDNTFEYFYHRYISNIYTVNKKFEISLKYKINFGDYAINEPEMKSIILGGKEANTIENEFCNEQGKFCSFQQIVDLKDYLYICSKINKKTYYMMLNKKTSKLNVFDKIENDSGFPFILNQFKGLDIYTSYSNYLITCLEPEYINEFNISNKKISSNWEGVKSNYSGPYDLVLCKLKIKEMSNF